MLPTKASVANKCIGSQVPVRRPKYLSIIAETDAGIFEEHDHVPFLHPHGSSRFPLQTVGPGMLGARKPDLVDETDSAVSSRRMLLNTNQSTPQLVTVFGESTQFIGDSLRMLAEHFDLSLSSEGFLMNSSPGWQSFFETNYFNFGDLREY
ncbi:hypothetical protein CEXT_153581 [Caerostris extrusa]|uniref:Uncharacterized protein n=1 Tax=Caerostris extrusa TaxID=172846 RepID=A0AAV4RW59_CAEEX|nr:hypothetical protein CEXT_153581 [Caerostris extrusa]